MKLKKLYIKDFRNIDELNLNFENTEKLAILIGNNGTGKSNILECISAIFSYLYYERKIKFKFEIQYEINNDIIKIHKDKRLIIYKNNENIPKSKLFSDNLLPSRVIALYSGEEERLNNLYYKPYINRNNKPQMIFINKDYWKIALISIFYSHLEDNKKFIKEELGINEVNNIIFIKKALKYERDEIIKNFYEIIKQHDQVLLSYGNVDAIAGTYSEILEIYNISERLFMRQNKYFKAIDAIESIKSTEILKYEEREFYLLLEKMLLNKESTLADIYIRINDNYDYTFSNNCSSF